MKQIDTSVDIDRRGMLKKIAYTTPKLIVLGSLLQAPATVADSKVPGPPGWPIGATGQPLGKKRGDSASGR